MIGNGQPVLYIFPSSGLFVVCGLITSSGKRLDIQVPDFVSKWLCILSLRHVVHLSMVYAW